MVKPSYSRKAAADTARPGAGRGIVEQADIDPAATMAEMSSLVHRTPPDHLDADSSYGTPKQFKDEGEQREQASTHRASLNQSVARKDPAGHGRGKEY